MSERELVQDFTLAPVPDGHTMSGWQIMLVILALGLSLPVFAIGAQVSQSLGLVDGAIACFGGCLLAGAVGVGPAIIGARVRLSTYVILTIVFGPIGGRVINTMLAVILIGWFANIADLLGSSVSASLAAQYGVSFGSFSCSAIAVLFMTATSIFGFKTMERFSIITVPILTVFMAGILWVALRYGDVNVAIASTGDRSLTMSSAVSAVIGLVVLMAVLLPDFARYARNSRAALLPVTSIAIGYPLVMMMGAIPAALVGQSDIMKIMIVLGVPRIALAVLVLSTWVGNTGNLYSATLTLSTLLPKRSVWQLGMGGAAIALIAAWFHVSTRFVPFLEILGIAATPIAAIYSCTYFFADCSCRDGAERLGSYNAMANTVIWGLGATAGLISSYIGGFAVPAPALEGLITTLILWVPLQKLLLPRCSVPASGGSG